MEKDTKSFTKKKNCLPDAAQVRNIPFCINALQASGFQCVYFNADNSLFSLQILLYLLEKDIIFYITSSAHIETQIPAFCDVKIIKMESLNSGLSLIRNENFVKNQSLKSNSGYIFISTSGSTGKPKFIFFEKSFS